jgi:hypothetical protein
LHAFHTILVVLAGSPFGPAAIGTIAQRWRGRVTVEPCAAGAVGVSVGTLDYSRIPSSFEQTSSGRDS